MQQGLAALTLAAAGRAEADVRETVAQRAASLMAHAEVLRPEGPGPFATVVQMHGCGGCKPFQRRYAEAVRAAGGAAIVLDSFAHRRIGTFEAYATVCTGARLQGAERAGDLFAAVHWARQQPWADPNRLIAAGWSHGGWTVMDALCLQPGEDMARQTGLADLPGEPLAGLSGVFLVYPYCGLASLSGRRPWRIQPATCAIVAGRDRVVGSRRPQAVLEELRAAGVPLDLHVWPEATHAFDEAEAEDVRVRYSEPRMRQAQALLQAMVTG